MIKAVKNRFKKKRFLHQNIAFLLKKFNIDTKILASETGIPLPTLFRIKREDNNPTLGTVEPIADYFRVDLHDLLYEDIATSEYQCKMKMGEIQYIPVMKLGKVKIWPIHFDAHLHIGTTGNLSKNSFGIETDTDSLNPVFYKNTIAIIDPEVTPKDMDYIFCTIGNDKAPIFRQYFSEGSQSFLKPINPNYGEMIAVKKFNTIGVVIKSIENYR